MTVIEPEVPRGTMAALAKVPVAAFRLIAETSGRLPPVGSKRRSPLWVPMTTVKLNDPAAPAAGMPHRPRGRSRVGAATSVAARRLARGAQAPGAAR